VPGSVQGGTRGAEDDKPQNKPEPRHKKGKKMTFQTYEAAINHAAKIAAKHDQEIYIFDDFPDGYQIGTDEDSETFFFGQDSLATVTPEGEIY
jgi:hypothetical protein